jgi:hypothetical protein
LACSREAQGGQEQCDQDRDDRHDDEQFDERERRAGGLARRTRPEGRKHAAATHSGPRVWLTHRT